MPKIKLFAIFFLTNFVLFTLGQRLIFEFLKHLLLNSFIIMKKINFSENSINTGVPLDRHWNITAEFIRFADTGLCTVAYANQTDSIQFDNIHDAMQYIRRLHFFYSIFMCCLYSFVIVAQLFCIKRWSHNTKINKNDRTNETRHFIKVYWFGLA